MLENSTETGETIHTSKTPTTQANLTRWFPQIDPRNPIIKFLAGIWAHIKWLAIEGGIVSLLVNALLSAYAHGTSIPNAFTDIQHWILVEEAKQHPIVTICLLIGIVGFVVLCQRADVAVQWDKAIDPYRDRYVIEKVKRLQPEPFLSPYLKAVKYVNRPADEELRERLERLQRHKSADGIGVCVIGIPMAGKTRMAWEAMRKTLGNYLFIRWHRGSNDPLPIHLLKRQPVVVWLDNLHEYANQVDAPFVAELPTLFLQHDVDVVIIATCWQEDIWQASDTSIATLLNRLIRIRPQNIDEDTARKLYQEVSAADPMSAPKTDFDQRWDKQTPGSLIVGNRTMQMRFINIPKHQSGAKQVLWTMQILAQAGFGTTQQEPRVRAACSTLFSWPMDDDDEVWQQSIGYLCKQGFLSERSFRELAILRPAADSYLDPDRCILPSDEWNRNWAAAWRKLPDAFDSVHDFEALAKLGFVLLDMESHADSVESLQCAEYCFKTLLSSYYAELTDSLIAAVHANLGVALLQRARLAARSDDIPNALDLATQAERECGEAWAEYTSLKDNASSRNWQRWNAETEQAKTNYVNAEALKNEFKRRLDT